MPLLRLSLLRPAQFMLVTFFMRSRVAMGATSAIPCFVPCSREPVGVKHSHSRLRPQPTDATVVTVPTHPLPHTPQGPLEHKWSPLQRRFSQSWEPWLGECGPLLLAVQVNAFWLRMPRMQPWLAVPVLDCQSACYCQAWIDGSSTPPISAGC